MKHILHLFIFLTFISGIKAQENRPITGYGNNLAHPEWGAAYAEKPILVGLSFADGISAPTGMERTNPREISNTLFTQDGLVDNDLTLSSITWVFGQFIDHDITLVFNGNSEPLMIPVPAGDSWFDPAGTGQVVIPFMRSVQMEGSGTGIENPRKYFNAITSFVDGSNIYGSEEYTASWVREYFEGKLKISPDGLLPFNTKDGTFNAPIDPAAPHMENPVGIAKKLFVAGDVRANENPLLLAFHTLFVREHNRQCEIQKELHPDWNDEQLYQKARKITSGILQQIAFNEWLPAMGIYLPEYRGYNPDVNPGIYNVFSAAAFRLGHTLLTSEILRMEADGSDIMQGNIFLKDAYFNPMAVYTDGGIDPLFQGMATQLQQDLDCKVVDDVRNFLFGAPGAGGLDLAAINIQRGRDRGLPDFNSIREALGFSPYNSIDEITNSAELALFLKMVYPDVNDIDPWVGFLAEKHMENAMSGETIMAIMELQFGAIRDGDRFYFENDKGLTEEELAEIRLTSLHDVIMRNTSIDLMQKEVFKAMPHEQIPRQFASLPKQNLAFSVYPNPTFGNTGLYLYSIEEGVVDVSLFDINGRMLEEFKFDIAEEYNTIQLELPVNLEAGMYSVIVKMGKELKSQKLIKL